MLRIPITPQEFEQLFPLACEWAEEQQRDILSRGVSLSPAQTADAMTVTIGVAHPERVRLLSVEAIPAPTHPLLVEAARLTGLISSDTGGMTLGYGIFIRQHKWGARWLVAHELKHVEQHERLGGLRQFLQPYLSECIEFGYPNGPLEQEAIRVQQQFLD